MNEEKIYKNKSKVYRNIKVLNKAPSDRQITAEQILREAYEHQSKEIKHPVIKITDPEELASYQLSKRREFENVVRRQRMNIGVWMKYARWEESQKDWERVRSIFERAINVDYRNKTLWTKYAEFEMKNRFINHARNIWDRAVQLLPRIDQFWYKYSLMEEKLGNLERARSIFERWMKWDPPSEAWESYIKLEMRCGNDKPAKINRARKIWRRYTLSHQNLSAYLKWAKFEERNGNIVYAREVYSLTLKELNEFAYEIEFFTAFSELEQRAKEIERAREIYKFALDHVPKQFADELYKKYTIFEKQYGSNNDIDDVVISKKRFKYEKDIKENQLNYDIWFDYIKLEENNHDINKTIEIFERAIANIPPIQEKKYWKRYIYLWIKYAIFVELTAKNISRTRKIYSHCLKIIPHSNFTFSKIWIMFAHFEIRQKDINTARKILGQAIGTCPKISIFNEYIEIETKLIELDRCRILYQKMLSHTPENCDVWIKYTMMEIALNEIDRARAIFELGIKQELLDMPEKLWTKYIEFETDLKEYANVENLYKRLMERTKNVKIWISYAESMKTIGKIHKAREIYKKGDIYFKNKGSNENSSRYELLKNWLNLEVKEENEHNIQLLKSKMPREVKKKRILRDENDNEIGQNDFIDYVFPDTDNAQESNIKILNIAHKWKKNKSSDK